MKLLEYYKAGKKYVKAMKTIKECRRKIAFYNDKILGGDYPSHGLHSLDDLTERLIYQNKLLHETKEELLK